MAASNLTAGIPLMVLAYTGPVAEFGTTALAVGLGLTSFHLVRVVPLVCSVRLKLLTKLLSSHKDRFSVVAIGDVALRFWAEAILDLLIKVLPLTMATTIKPMISITTDSSIRVKASLAEPLLLEPL